MLSSHLTDETYQLAARYDLGEPVRVYRTPARRALLQSLIRGTIIGFVTITFLVALLSVFIHPTFDLFILIYSVFLGVPAFIVFILLIIYLLFPQINVFVCSHGFILHRKRTHRAVRWEEVEWVALNGHCIVYLRDGQRVIVNQWLTNITELAHEIELKARLVRRPERPTDLEGQYAYLRSNQKASEQVQFADLLEKLTSVPKEPAEEAFQLQAEYPLGEFLATHRAGFKGILRNKVIDRLIGYILLSLPFLLAAWFIIGSIFRFFPEIIPLKEIMFLFWLAWSFLFSLFSSRSSTRFLRLHLYSGGFILIDHAVFEVVRWEQIEKIIYHKTIPIVPRPLCHIYLTNGETLAVSGYIHKREDLRRVFDEHVKNSVQAG